MAVKFVFEDGDDTPSSIMLKNSFNKNNIFFSNGCSKVLKKACAVQNPGDTVYIFYDVSPNYKKTVNGYDTLIQTIKQNKLKDIYVVPIICIEYYICKMFYQYGCLCLTHKYKQVLIDNLIAKFDWQNVVNQAQLTHYELESLEHMYKNIISSSKMRCQRNEFKYDDKGVRETNNLRGIFYEKDCNCDLKFCAIKCRDDILLKAERLYGMLPVFTIVSREHEEYLRKIGYNPVLLDNNDIKKSCQDFYNAICASMNANRICVVI